MNMKLKLLLLIVFASFGINKAMSEDIHCLMVWLKNGEKVILNLETLPKTEFKNGNLEITATGFSVSYPISDVIKYTNVDSESLGIAKGRDYTIGISQHGNTIVVDNLPENTKVNVYSIDGTKVMDATVQSSTQATFDMNNLPEGVYVVKAKSYIYKFMKQ